LLSHGWESGLIGSVMTVGCIAGMLMTAPAGAVAVPGLVARILNGTGRINVAGRPDKDTPSLTSPRPSAAA
jgi:hypothetical protein